LVSGKEALEMVLESKLGQTVRSTSVNGEITKLTAKVNSFMWMAMCMMDFGQTTKRMAQEFTSM
jgi:hypothetical protein